jgi:hypothetical protein
VFKEIDPTDEAEFKVMIKNHYKQYGTMGVYQTIYEMLKCTQMAYEVLKEIKEAEFEDKNKPKGT